VSAAGPLAIFLTIAACGVAAPLSSPPGESSSSPVAAATTPPPAPSPTASPTPRPLEGLALELVAGGLAQPVDVKARPGDGVLFVAEQAGVIRRIANGGEEHPVTLDISDEVNSFSIEQGLLGFAFHPDYPSDPRVFVFHSLDNNDNVLASYETAGDPDVLDPGTRRQLIVIDKEPERMRHNGGSLMFGPDGLLYLGVGDAERGRLHGQNPATLQASVLRIDVDRGDPYAIPPGNPFAEGRDGGIGVDGAPEVWWFGLRNPWRFGFDAETGLAYIADVGQERAEEVNVVPLADGALNFGWPAREGLEAFLDQPLVSDPIDPVIEIRHDERDRGCSVTGGEVYRGEAIPEFAGHYFYADWCNGWVRSFRFADGQAAEPQDWSEELDAGLVSSFGRDGPGEILVLDWQDGRVQRIVPVRQGE
jgi:glucose/arabinose dehydrogenase